MSPARPKVLEGVDYMTVEEFDNVAGWAAASAPFERVGYPQFKGDRAFLPGLGYGTFATLDGLFIVLGIRTDWVTGFWLVTTDDGRSLWARHDPGVMMVTDR